MASVTEQVEFWVGYRGLAGSPCPVADELRATVRGLVDEPVLIPVELALVAAHLADVAWHVLARDGWSGDPWQGREDALLEAGEDLVVSLDLLHGLVGSPARRGVALEALRSGREAGSMLRPVVEVAAAVVLGRYLVAFPPVAVFA
jgi:hypothetical protein